MSMHSYSEESMYKFSSFEVFQVQEEGVKMSMHSYSEESMYKFSSFEVFQVQAEGVKNL
jgi:hypothetical protein